MPMHLYPVVRETELGHWQPLVCEQGKLEPVLAAQAFRSKKEADEMARRMTETERTRRELRERREG